MRGGRVAWIAGLVVLTAAIPIGMGCAGGRGMTAPAPDRIAQGGEVRDPRLSPFIDRAFEELGLVPGMAVAVVEDTSVVLLQGFGVADVSSMARVTPSTPFYIASSTKSFMGTAAALLEERGVWRLEDPLSRWLPSVTLPPPLSAEAVTLRQLLTHTSRIENDPIVYRTAYSGEHDRETLLGLLERSEVLEPGFDYGNIGYVVASLAMDAAVDDGWQDVLERELFVPLGMRHTSARRSDFDAHVLALPHGVAMGPRLFEIRPYIKRDVNMHAAGGIITTAADLARWLEVNLSEGRLDGRTVLSPEAIRTAHRLHATTDAKFYDFERTGYGLGWYHSRYDGDLVLHHFGNYPGFRAHVSFMPEKGMGVAVLTNESAQGYYVPEMVATWVYDRLLDKPGLETKYDSVMGFLRDDAARVRASIAEDRDRRAARPDSLALPLGTYVGTYWNADGGTFVVDDPGIGRLRASLGVLSSFAEPMNDHSLVRVELVPGSGESVEFFISGERADSLEYGGLVFRRR